MPLSLGPHWQCDLRRSPYRLRFALSDGDYLGRYVTKLISSYDRARKLAREALPSEGVIGVIGSFPNPSIEMSAEWLGWKTGTGFENLAELGVSTEAAIAEWKGHWWPDDIDDPEAELWIHRAVRLNWEQVDILLWNQIAQDLGVAPRAPVLAKFVDLASGVCVNAYDDRGMDVTCLNKAPLMELYRERNDWLLGHDRDRMLEVFEHSATYS